MFEIQKYAFQQALDFQAAQQISAKLMASSQQQKMYQQQCMTDFIDLKVEHALAIHFGSFVKPLE